jgi:hypothetical protein
MDLALFKESRQVKKRSGKGFTKSMKPVENFIEKDGKYSLQHDIVKATVVKKKVKEKDVFDKTIGTKKNKFTRSQKKN